MSILGDEGRNVASCKKCNKPSQHQNTRHAESLVESHVESRVESSGQEQSQKMNGEPKADACIVGWLRRIERTV